MIIGLITIFLYLLSILMVSLGSKLLYEYDMLDSWEAETNPAWFIPFVNTCYGIVMLIMGGALAFEHEFNLVSKASNSKFLKWLFNKDL